MLERFTAIENFNNSIEEVNNLYLQGAPLAIFGVNFSSKCFLAGCSKYKSLYIVKDNLSLDKAKEEIEELSARKVTVLYPKDEVLLYNKAVSKYSLFKRLNALYEIKHGAEIVVTTFEALLQLMPKEIKTLVLKKNESYNLQSVISSLVKLGYTREEMITSQGGFSVRGDILEIFPINYPNPLRIDFFGDEIENIKEFELESREKISYYEKISILMATDVSFMQGEEKEIIEELKKEIKLAPDAEALARIGGMTTEISEKFSNGLVDSSFSVLMPLLRNTTSNIFDYISRDFIVFYDECKAISDGLDLLLKEHEERCKELYKTGEIFSFSKHQLSSKDELIDTLKKSMNVALQTLTTEIYFFSPLKTITLKTGQVTKYQLKFNEFLTDVNSWLVNKYNIIVCTADRERAEKLKNELVTNGIRASINNEKIKFTGINILTDKLESGIIFHDEKLVIVGSGDLYARKVKEKKLKHSKKSEFFQAPETGDYAVHETHGIGIVKGVKRISTTEGTKDYISVEYSGGDILYVPVEQMDILSRYLGGEKKPSLSKIGGKEFDRIKERVKASIKEMSFSLKELYKTRNEQVGFKFTEDSEMQELFEERFPYELTEDQKIASNDIMQDMCSSKVMDRLICGDVGFGKTEVALRACFRAVISGKQVAFLAPTTILSEQHYKTAKERFKDFGVRICSLNRFRSKSEQDLILKELEEGKIDIIIGTHRLISEDVKFKDLGLLVLDEEQRFGVEHKEKIKLLKKNVDTLTLSATPIPRTLHMSLSGIRDISTINTPPKDRLPVQTYVTEETEGLIKDAVLREISRGGQCYILYNRVETIYTFSQKLQLLMPSVKFTVAHGQMEEKALEKSIMEFYDGKTDVLISTTIIENGIDLPRANTIIVIDADRLGLSTLYQLKGRVGRSSRLAHAYFTFKREKVLSETAYKRLTAIMEFTEMGSGFKIAMRDLEIRGAGNVLGKEQHGHMDKVGYELYTKLLKEEMGEEIPSTIELDIRVSAYISTEYIPSNSGRMDAYKEIAEINSLEAKKELSDNLVDLYGELPFEVENLLSIAMVKCLSAKIKAKGINVKKGSYNIVFDSIEAFNQEGLHKALTKYKKYCQASFSAKPQIDFIADKASNEDILYLMEEFLKYALSFSANK